MRSLVLVLAAFGVLVGVMVMLVRPRVSRDESPAVAVSPTSRSTQPTKAPPASRPTSLPAAQIEQRIADWGEQVDDWFVRQRQRQARDVPTQLSRGAAFIRDEHFDLAVACFDRVLRRDPDNAEALSGKAMAFWKLGYRTESVEIHTTLVAARPGDVEARFNFAVALASVGRDGDAIAQYRKVVEHRPEHGRALYNLAGLIQSEGKLAEALTLFRRVTELNPALPSAWFQRGTVASDLGRFEEARASFARATELEPTDAQAHNNLALALMALGKRAEALAGYERSVALDGSLVPALCNWAEALLEGDASEEARQRAASLCRRALDIESRNERAKAMLARLASDER